MDFLTKILLIDDSLDHKIQKHPLEKLAILENIITQLMEWNQDENIVRDNEYDYIQKPC